MVSVVPVDIIIIIEVGNHDETKASLAKSSFRHQSDQTAYH